MISIYISNSIRGYYYVAEFSTRGPTSDNRIKPDVVAIGYFVNSSSASGSNAQTCGFVAKVGTYLSTFFITHFLIKTHQWPHR